VSVLGALLRKELRIELRTLESVPGMSLFAVTTFVVFHFGLDRPTVEGDLASGVLVVTILFAAMLGVNRLWVADEEQGGFDAVLLAPIDRTSLFVAKAIAMFVYLVVLEVVALPAFAFLLLEPPLRAELVLVLLMADVGIAVIGTLIGALAVKTRARDLIGPLLALPLLVPIVIAAAQACQPLLATRDPGNAEPKYLLLLGLYDLVFALIAYAVFDPLLED
jgi:heme exporter protein B